MAGKGGSIPGSGRQSNAAKHEVQITKFTDLAASGLSQCFDNLATLADGGYERTEIKYEPARLIKRKDLARDKDGNVIRDARGKPTIVEVLEFPDADGDVWIETERKVIKLGPDFRANEYLVDRVMGRPRQAVEVTGEDGGPISMAFEDAIAKVYGEVEE